MNLAFDHPAALLMALAGILPLLRNTRILSGWPRLVPEMGDGASGTINTLLRALAVSACVLLALAIAGPHVPGGTIARLGSGAHLVLLVDRSSSMNSSFAGRAADADAESKAQAAKRLLQDFAHSRPHDRIGVVGFSTMPILVLPLSAHKPAVQAAIGAIDRPGLAYTDVGRGLAMALSLFEPSLDASAARVVVLISDGAALIDRRVQERLRADIAAQPVQIYWLFLRSAGSPGIYDEPADPRLDNPQSMPERHLDLFFKSLGVPYRAFEANSPEDVANAIAELDRQQQQPLRYMERIARTDLRGWVLALACICLALLIAAKLAEVKVPMQELPQ